MIVFISNQIKSNIIIVAVWFCILYNEPRCFLFSTGQLHILPKKEYVVFTKINTNIHWLGGSTSMLVHRIKWKHIYFWKLRRILKTIDLKCYIVFEARKKLEK